MLQNVRVDEGREHLRLEESGEERSMLERLVPQVRRLVKVLKRLAVAQPAFQILHNI